MYWSNIQRNALNACPLREKFAKVNMLAKQDVFNMIQYSRIYI